jgi:hypothetical protein
MCLSPPTNLSVRDVPNDAGRSIDVTWTKSSDDTGAEFITGYDILRAEGPDGEFETVGHVPRLMETYRDGSTEDGLPYYYKVVMVSDSGDVETAIVGPVSSKGQWFHTGRINVLIGVLLYTGLLVFFIYGAKKGKKLFLRPISGLSAVDEAVGRATEMGKPILYVPGLSTVSDVATIASLNILSQVAKKTAEYETRLIVPNRDAVVYTVAREVVKEACYAVGRPDAFDPSSVFYVTDSQFGYAAAVDGIMIREKPATNFFLGMFWAESLILAETGASTGAIQIAGTDAVTQLPFFITACDYTLIGEELYAASAYLSNEPLLVGSLKGQDYAKAIIWLLLLIGSVIGIAGGAWVFNLFRVT